MGSSTRYDSKSRACGVVPLGDTSVKFVRMNNPRYLSMGRVLRTRDLATGEIAMSIKTRKLSHPMGEEILDVDLTQPMDDSVFGQIYQTLLDRSLIAFRGQTITREQYIAFMQRFGEPSLEQGGRLPDYPAVTCLINTPRTDGGAPDAHVPGSDWHSDGSFRINPTKITVLHAIKIPETGGDTEFANMYLAYETLSDGMKKMLDGMQCV